MNRRIGKAQLLACGTVLAATACLAQSTPSTLQVDVTNFVLYNYDTLDTAQFGMNPKPTSVMTPPGAPANSARSIVITRGTGAFLGAGAWPGIGRAV
jgi:hypothetical protein